MDMIFTDDERAASDIRIAAYESRIKTLQPEWQREQELAQCNALPYEFEGVNMLVRYTNGNMQFEQDGLDRKSAFEFLATVQEMFNEPSCGACGSEDIRCSVREHEGNKFYNFLCSKCGSQLDLGQKKDGKGMWIKRRDKDGNELANRGWYKYNRGESSGGSQRQEREPPPQDDSTPF